MEYLSPIAKQIIIAGSPQLAAVSVGGVVGYPNVLIEQLKSNGTDALLDFEITTWVGSIHGISGLPAVFMPTIMQRYGRKPAFIASCLIILLGWIITFLAENITTILIAEAFHGLGSNSIIVVSHFTISEMVNPKIRLISMGFYVINLTLGLCLVAIMGRYLHWKTVGYVMSLPMFVAVIVSYIWPESPSWLAFKGDLEKCEKSFLWLRGSDEDSRNELSALIKAQSITTERQTVVTSWRQILKQIRRRDFYIPSFQIFVCLCLFYCSGTLVILIYTMEIIRKATGNETAAFYGMISIEIILYIGCLFNAVLIKIFNNKPVFLFSGFGITVCLASASLVSYLQSIGILSSNSLICLYCLVAYMVLNSAGISCMAFTVSAELMPVKHRDLGGALYVILTCLLHFASLKLSPYLFLYLEMSGTFLVFALNAAFCSLYIWKCVPETKNRSLLEIEYFFAHGDFESVASDCTEMIRLRTDDDKKFTLEK